MKWCKIGTNNGQGGPDTLAVCSALLTCALSRLRGCSEENDQQESLHKLVTVEHPDDDFNTSFPLLKANVIEVVNELLIELGNYGTQHRCMAPCCPMVLPPL